MLSSSISSALVGLNLTNFARVWSYQQQFPPHPHAGLHDEIGGVAGYWGLEPVQNILEKYIGSKNDQLNLLGFTLEDAFKNYPHYHDILTQKGFWRSWLRDSPTYCTPDTPVTKCVPKCRESVDKALIARTFFMFLMRIGNNEGAPDLPAGGFFAIRWEEPSELASRLSSEGISNMYSEAGEALCASPDFVVKGDNFESR